MASFRCGSLWPPPPYLIDTEDPANGVVSFATPPPPTGSAAATSAERGRAASFATPDRPTAPPRPRGQRAAGRRCRVFASPARPTAPPRPRGQRAAGRRCRVFASPVRPPWLPGGSRAAAGGPSSASNLVRVTSVDADRRPDYPAAERLDLVEQRHGLTLADPYRWLEDPADPRTVAWSAAQDELARACLDGLPGRGPARRAADHAAPRGRRPGAGLAGRPALLHPARARPGARGAAGRASRTAPSACWSTRARSTRPAPPRWTPRWPATRATCWPTSCPPAGTRSPGSTSSTSPPASGWTARSTAAATPPSPGCPAARSSTTSAGWRRTRCRPARSSSTAGSGGTGSAPTRPTDVEVHGAGLDPTNYYDVIGVPGRPLAAGHRARRAPRRGTTSGSPTCAAAAGDRELREIQVGVDARGASVGRAATACST